MEVDVTLNVEPINVDVEVANRAGGSGIKEVLHDDTLVGDGVAAELSVNTDVIATNARVDQVEETAENAKAIAEGKATGYVFDTVEDMNAWIETNSSILKLGDNLYIRAVDVPDYWWDGAAVQQLETQKVDLTGYVKNTDYVKTTSAGLVNGTSSGLGISANTTGQLFINLATDAEIDNKYSKYRPIVPANLDYAVKTGVTTNTIELTDDEKTAARTWLGAVGDTDYSTPRKAGLIRALGAYNLTVDSNDGTILCNPLDLAQYKSSSNYGFISKITLENIKDDYVKRGVTENTIEFTDDEKTSARNLIGAISSTDYATGTTAGVIKAYDSNAFDVSSSGNPICKVRSLDVYKKQNDPMFISKGTLENIKNDLVKRAVTGNDIELTDEEKAAAQAWLGVDALVGDVNTILDNINGEVI